MAPPKKSLRNYLQISQKQRINPFSKTQGRSLLGGLQHEEMNQGMKRAHRGKGGHSREEKLLVYNPA